MIKIKDKENFVKRYICLYANSFLEKNTLHEKRALHISSYLVYKPSHIKLYRLYHNCSFQQA